MGEQRACGPQITPGGGMTLGGWIMAVAAGAPCPCCGATLEARSSRLPGRCAARSVSLFSRLSGGREVLECPECGCEIGEEDESAQPSGVVCLCSAA